MKTFKNEAEVEQYFTETSHKVIIFEGTVYAIGDYMSQHPGGSDIIEKLLGKCIDEPFEEAEHTRAARQIFRDLEKVGYIAGDTKSQDKDANATPAGLDGFKL